MTPAGYVITMLKVLTVLMVVYISFRSVKADVERYLRSILLIIGAVIIQCSSSGAAGLIYVATGMLAGALCALLQYRFGRTGSGDLFVSTALGALAGPVGVLLIFAIVYILSVTERVFHAGTTRIRERYAGYLLDAGMLEGSGPMKGDGHRQAPCPAAETIRLESLTFPWRIKVALATLVIVFSGLMF